LFDCFYNNNDGDGDDDDLIESIQMIDCIVRHRASAYPINFLLSVSNLRNRLTALSATPPPPANKQQTAKTPQ
jgi:hypothetical protein